MLNEGAFSQKMEELDKILSSTGLRSADDSPGTVFSQLMNLVRRLRHPSAAAVAISFTPEGLPIVVPRLEFADTERKETARIDFEVPMLYRSNLSITQGRAFQPAAGEGGTDEEAEE